RDECRKDGKEGDGLQPFDYIMAGFVAFEEPGLKIYAAHRVVPQSVTIDFEKCMERIRDYFECRELSSDVTEKDLAQAKEDDCVFIMASQKQGTWLLTLKEEKRKALLNSDRGASWQALDVAILHRGILDQLLGVPDDVQLIYEKDAQTAVSLVSNGTASIAFLLRPTSSEQVRDCAEALEPMPQKSTYFFPKLPTGTVIYPLF
ncbi:MAG: DUF1015 family protein, partial [Candidatus Hydrogenedentes bacterium]|nr:DUF1015 family protein [Candidatus Hydrogenedentota bacterium]